MTPAETGRGKRRWWILAAFTLVFLYWTWPRPAGRLFTSEELVNELKQIARRKNIEREDVVRLLGEPSRMVNNDQQVVLFWKGNRRSFWDCAESEYVVFLPSPGSLANVRGTSYCIYTGGGGNRYTGGWKTIKKALVGALGLQHYVNTDEELTNWGAGEYSFPLRR